jgi:hypothetical protein
MFAWGGLLMKTGEAEAVLQDRIGAFLQAKGFLDQGPLSWAIRTRDGVRGLQIFVDRPRRLQGLWGVKVFSGYLYASDYFMWSVKHRNYSIFSDAPSCYGMAIKEGVSPITSRESKEVDKKLQPGEFVFSSREMIDAEITKFIDIAKSKIDAFSKSITSAPSLLDKKQCDGLAPLGRDVEIIATAMSRQHAKASKMLSRLEMLEKMSNAILYVFSKKYRRNPVESDWVRARKALLVTDKQWLAIDAALDAEVSEKWHEVEALLLNEMSTGDPSGFCELRLSVSAYRFGKIENAIAHAKRVADGSSIFANLAEQLLVKMFYEHGNHDLAQERTNNVNRRFEARFGYSQEVSKERIAQWIV